MEKDRLLQEVDCGEIKRGDFIRIENVGAYTVVLTPPFIHPAPPVLVRGPDGYVAIRRRQNFNDFFGTYLF
jgi:diaminopimelate decarboxylase